jgi:putative nucleotidyltransferase with HDIG domain
MSQAIDLVKEFVKSSFRNNSAYSFGDWRIMVEHSMKVGDFAVQIAREISCDVELLTIEALLHDIGKTYPANPKILRQQHSGLGYKVAGNFLSRLRLSQERTDKLEEFLLGNLDTIEGRIIKDADIIAFYSDEKLQRALKVWGDHEGLSDELQRKADKMEKLQFDVSRQIAKPLYEKMRTQWQLR